MVSKNKKIILTLIASVLLISIITMLLIVVQIPYTGYVVGMEKEPFIQEECENVELKSVIEWGSRESLCLNKICDRTEQYCIEKNFWGNCIEFRDRCIHEVCMKYRKKCSLIIENIDDTAGTWNFQGYSKNRVTNEEKLIDSISVYVKPTKSGEVLWNFDYDAGESIDCLYKQSVNLPTKTICEEKTKYRNKGTVEETIRYCNLWKKLVGKCQEEKPAIPLVSP